MAATGDTFEFKLPSKHNSKCKCDALKSFKCEEISSYSCDGENVFLPDDSQIRYLCLPEDPDDVLFDLKDNFETFIERDRSAEMIDRVLRSIHHIEQKEGKKKKSEVKSLEDDLTGQLARLQLDPDIICRRGLLTDIMTTPYLLQSKNKDGWSIAAIKYDNKIFLLRTNKPDETWGTTEERQLSTYTGSKFEQYVSKRTLEGPSIADQNEIVDTRQGFYSLTKAQMGKHKLIYGGEVDCCDLEAKGGKRTYVQFKTTLMLPSPPKYFQRYECKSSESQSLKLLKWWAQSTLVDIPRIVCGIKDHDAIVYQVKTYKVRDLPTICNNQWNPCVCFTFLDGFLSYVKDVMADAEEDPRKAHLFTWPPGEKFVKHEEMAPDSDYCFLPEWFCKPSGESQTSD